MGVLQAGQIHDSWLGECHQLWRIFAWNAASSKTRHADTQSFPRHQAPYRRHLLSRLVFLSILCCTLKVCGPIASDPRSDSLASICDDRHYITHSFLGNDIDGYKTTMPVIHTATHLGWHPVFGPPTGKKLRWSGIPNCFIKKFDGQWKFTAEWNLPGRKIISLLNGYRPLFGRKIYLLWLYYKVYVCHFPS